MQQTRKGKGLGGAKLSSKTRTLILSWHYIYISKNYQVCSDLRDLMCKKDAKIAKNNRLNFLSYRTYLRFLFRYYWKHNVKQLFMSKLIPIWVETICYFIRSQFIWLGNLEKLNWNVIWYYRFLLSTKACGSQIL